MKSQTVKTIGGVMSAVALISGGAGVAQAATIEPAAAAPASATTLAAADVADTEALRAPWREPLATRRTPCPPTPR